HLLQRQQWLGLRWHWVQRAVLQLDGSLRHAARALRLPDPHHSLRRLAGTEEGSARRARDAADPWANVRGSVAWRDPDRGRADLLPGVLAGAGRRTTAHACREGVLRCKT